MITSRNVLKLNKRILDLDILDIQNKIKVTF